MDFSIALLITGVFILLNDRLHDRKLAVLRGDDCANHTEVAKAEPLTNDAKDAERYRWLRDLKCNSFSIGFNNGPAPNYMTAAQWIDDFADQFEADDPKEVAKMRAQNVIWDLQIYPRTPVSFCMWHGATLDRVIDDAMAEEKEEGL